MDIHEKYEYWLTFDDNTKNELESITDKKEIEDRFYKDLEFGTGGLRGIMGAGANRMNKYTVGKATKGLCEYLKNVPQRFCAITGLRPFFLRRLCPLPYFLFQ